MWPHALEHSADPKRAGHYLDQLKTTRAAAALKAASPEQAELLAALFSGSPALSELLIAHPDWLATSLDPEQLKHPRPEQGLRREVNAWLKPALRRRDFDPTFARLREFKQREMPRIAARDLARLDNFTGITRELSEVADVCLHTVLQLCWTHLMDAEFLAQGLCMAHGWSEANTLRALQRAQATGALPAADAESLLENYRQLRRLEGILRRWSYAGETLLPDDPAPLGRVAVRCGFPNAEMFLQAVRKWRTNVRNVYATFFS